jgi:hypothetical protein
MKALQRSPVRQARHGRSPRERHRLVIRNVYECLDIEPEAYLTHLSSFCQQELASDEWSSEGMIIAFTLGARADRSLPGLLAKLEDHCRTTLQRQLVDGAVVDELVQVYNLTLRARRALHDEQRRELALAAERGTP